MRSQSRKRNQDYQAVQAFLNGHEESGKALYLSIDQFLFCYLQKKLKGTVAPAEIEEMKQEIIYKTLMDIKKYRGTCKFSTWICGYANYFILRKLTEKKKEELQYQKIKHSYINSYLDPLDFVIQKEEKQIIISYLNLLDEKTYHIFQLRFFLFMSFSSIAAQMNLSYATVYQRYRKGIEFLKQAMQTCEYEFDWE